MDGTDVLAQICAYTRAEVARRKEAVPLNAIRHKLHQRSDPPRGFGAALTQTVAKGGFGLIAEIKQASPSGGMIRPEFDPPALARAYQAGGATCLSVLTDAPHFMGDLKHMVAARAAVPLPVLRKEFILDPWQVYESRVFGADCILLIMAALTDSEARELEDLARALDMDVLVEVHNAAELDRALGLQTPLIGINNRNLKTLQTTIETTIELAATVPADRFLITESGIRTHEDVLRLAEVGARSFLVGESLLRQPDVTVAAQTLLGTRAVDAA